MTTSKKDVILCRGIWYVTTLLSVIGLSISLNLLWPSPGNSSSRFIRDGAVSITTFYAVTLLRFFIDPPSTTYKEYLTNSERFPQSVVSCYALLAVIGSNTLVNCKCIEDNTIISCKEFGMSVSLFVVSVFSGGLGLIQLSDKLRMEIRHALFTLFLAWLFCLLGIAFVFCIHDHPKISFCIFCFQEFLCIVLAMFNFSLAQRVHPLPA